MEDNKDLLADMEQKEDYNRSKLDKLSSELSRLQIQVKTLTSQLYYKDTTISELQAQLNNQILKHNIYIPKDVHRKSMSQVVEEDNEREIGINDKGTARYRDLRTNRNEPYKVNEQPMRNKPREDSPYHKDEAIYESSTTRYKSPYRASARHNSPQREVRKEYNNIKASYETTDTKRMGRRQEETKTRTSEKSPHKEFEEKEKIIKNIESNLLTHQLDKQRVLLDINSVVRRRICKVDK